MDEKITTSKRCLDKQLQRQSDRHRDLKIDSQTVREPDA